MEGNKSVEYLKVVFETIKDITKSEIKVAVILETSIYILNLFDSLKNQCARDYIGCSARRHITYIYSDRLSSRLLGWSREGVDQLARLRVYGSNGVNLYDLNLKRKQERIKEAKITEPDFKVAE